MCGNTNVSTYVLTAAVASEQLEYPLEFIG